MVRSGAMETTLYDEHSYPQQQPSGGGVGLGMKRGLTLDFERGGKRSRFAGGAPVLSSPDLQLLKIATPEMEKWILSQGALATPTPSSGQQNMFPANPTDAQVDYARGFEAALSELHHSDSSQGPFAQGHQPHQQQHHQEHQPTYANLERVAPGSVQQQQQTFANAAFAIKDEPQTVPSVGSSSPPLSPIDMESQEKIKLERKRQRNRLAASKCRRRKLERISRLEDKVKGLKSENGELGAIVRRLKEQVYVLKEQVMEHASSGCQITVAF